MGRAVSREQASRRQRLGGAAVVLVLAALLSGCWGYNRSAKRGAYVLDTILIAGGGGLIALGVMNPPKDCDEINPNLPPNPACHDPVAGPISGTLVAGTMLAVGGIVALVVNATRKNVKTSR
jgi:hypothetical protein